MKNIRKQVFNIIPAVILIIIAGGIFSPSSGTINSVILTPANPTIRHGNNWYLAGIQYEFKVEVIEPAAAALSDYDHVDLTIPLGGGVNIVATWTAPGVGSGSFDFTSGNEGGSSIAAADGTTVTGTTNLTLLFRITFAWDIAAAANTTPVAQNILVDAVSDFGAYPQQSMPLTYGFCNQVIAFNLAQDGDAADGFINPHYTAGNFNITGTLVYDITGTDATDAIPAAVIGNITLHEDTNNDGTVNVATGYTDGGGTEDISFTVNYTYFNLHALGNTWWRCRAVLQNPDASTFTATGQNSLLINVNRVQVTSMTVDLGGGRDDVNTHWRSYLVPGTRFTINAVMQNGSGNMVGNTTFTINYNGGTAFNITIPNGQNSASAIIPLASTPDFGANTTLSYQYYVTRITGNSYGDQGDGSVAIGANNTGVDQIDDSLVAPDTYGGVNYTSQLVYWENTDPPDITTDDIVNINTSATTAVLRWPAIDPVVDPADKGDFYEYRIYYRRAGSADPFSQFDGDDDPLLRGIANNPSNAPNPALHIDASGYKYTTVTGLAIFSDYEYYLVAVDLFGNESPVEDEGGLPVPPNPYSQFTTTPFSIEAVVSDGITSYQNTDFTAGPDTYAARPFRQTGIKVTLTIIVASGEQEPDVVTVWFTNNASDGTDIDIYDSIGAANTGAFISPDLLESAIAERSGPNSWTAYLPTTSNIIRTGNQVRFIVATKIGIDESFSDSSMGDTDANNNEWSFSISTPATFTPWPTRVLNNVITDKNPVAYPSYYLTSDAHVTIKVYDVKGRPVTTLLDNAFRRGGQNIKDQGWRGTNKAGRKLGVGLYHIHFYAKRTSDGRVILNKFKKVVIAR